MAIYNGNGIALNHAYDGEGNELYYAYDGEGNVIYTSGEEPPKTKLKVMTYNVGQWYTGTGTNVPSAKDQVYYDLHNGIIQRANADILCINEYWDNMSSNRTALSMLEKYYPYIVTKSGGSGYYGRAVCSKYPIVDYTVRSYSDNANRYRDTCSITVDDITFTLCITHIDTDATKRANEIIELRNYLQTLPRFICCGDLNSIYCTQPSDSDYIAVIKPLLDAGFNLANCSEFGYLQTYGNPNSEDASYYTRALDNIVTSSNIEILSVVVDNTKETDSITDDKVDHMPLIAELQLD